MATIKYNVTVQQGLYIVDLALRKEVVDLTKYPGTKAGCKSFVVHVITRLSDYPALRQVAAVNPERYNMAVNATIASQIVTAVFPTFIHFHEQTKVNTSNGSNSTATV